MPWLNFLPYFFSLVALVLIIITLAAGTRPGMLDELAFLTVWSYRVVEIMPKTNAHACLG
jgi:hypothetical protein